MIEIKEYFKNKDHVMNLFEFYKDIDGIYSKLNIGFIC